RRAAAGRGGDRRPGGRRSGPAAARRGVCLWPLFQIPLPAESIPQFVRIGRHHRVRAGAGDDPACDVASALPVALLPDPVSRELSLEAEQHICHEGSTPSVRAAACIPPVSSTIRLCESLRIDDARTFLEGYRRVVTNP